MQVVDSMTDLYAFMGEASNTLDLKVHGEVHEETAEDPYAEREQVRGAGRGERQRTGDALRWE